MKLFLPFVQPKKKELKAIERYRVEDGKVCIEMRLNDPRQIFDVRDPSPFIEKDLDPDAVRYILASAEEFSCHTPFKIVIHSGPSERLINKEELQNAVRSYFAYESELLRRDTVRIFSMGRRFLLVGIAALFTCLFLAHWSSKLIPVPIGSFVREGFVISGWVAMWKPIEVFLYDWRPLVQKRKFYENLKDAEVKVLSINEPTSSAPGEKKPFVANQTTPA